MPGNLRKGKSLTKFIDSVGITDNGKNIDLVSLKKRAPKQAALMSILMKKNTLDSHVLNNIFPEWKKYSKRPIEKIGLKWKQIYRFSMYYIIIILIFWFMDKEQEFIYFQF